MVPTPISKTKLTKKFLMASPEGIYLVSNCGKSPQEPTFEEPVSPPSGRGEQWQRIVAAKADQQTCRTFKGKIEYMDWLASFLQAMALQKTLINEDKAVATTASFRKP